MCPGRRRREPVSEPAVFQRILVAVGEGSCADQLRAAATLPTEQKIVTALRRRHLEPHERRSDVEHNNDTDIAGFEARWRTALEDNDWITVTYAVVGLTNFGERPIQSVRLAEVLGRPVSEAEALARQWGWPGTQVEDGLIFVNPERARSAARRRVQVGDRRFGVSGCAGDIFLYAPLVRPSLHLEETCTTTGTPIRIVFTPIRVEHVDPSSAVVPLPPAQELKRTEGMQIEDIDANL